MLLFGALFGFGGVIGPCFFEIQAANADTVNGLNYWDMLRNFCWPFIDDMDVSDMWFQ